MSLMPEAMPLELRQFMESELRSGERIQYRTHPVPSRMARKSIPLVIFGVFWTAFALFWTGGAFVAVSHARTGTFLEYLFPLFGLPFVLIGIGLLSSPVWMRRAAARTAYLVTDRRAIIMRGGWFGKMHVRSFEPEALRDLERNQYADGSGDLIFARDWHRGKHGRQHSTPVGFLAVNEVKTAEAAIQNLVQAHTSGSDR
jgi:hypothetical protein